MPVLFLILVRGRKKINVYFWSIVLWFEWQTWNSDLEQTLFNIPIAIETAQLKVRQIRNDFFKPMFLPKNERTNSTLLLLDLFSFVFWKKVKTPKRHFEINWPLGCISNPSFFSPSYSVLSGWTIANSINLAAMGFGMPECLYVTTTFISSQGISFISSEPCQPPPV